MKHILYLLPSNKLASLKATLVRNSTHSLTHSLTGVRCRATSVAKKEINVECSKLSGIWEEVDGELGNLRAGCWFSLYKLNLES